VKASSVGVFYKTIRREIMSTDLKQTIVEFYEKAEQLKEYL